MSISDNNALYNHDLWEWGLRDATYALFVRAFAHVCASVRSMIFTVGCTKTLGR